MISKVRNSLRGPRCVDQTRRDSAGAVMYFLWVRTNQSDGFKLYIHGEEVEGNTHTGRTKVGLAFESRWTWSDRDVLCALGRLSHTMSLVASKRVWYDYSGCLSICGKQGNVGSRGFFTMTGAGSGGP